MLYLYTQIFKIGHFVNSSIRHYPDDQGGAVLERAFIRQLGIEGLSQVFNSLFVIK